jgi:hypothetical protein
MKNRVTCCAFFLLCLSSTITLAQQVSVNYNHYDLKQKELVWRGIAENTLSNNGTRTRRM